MQVFNELVRGLERLSLLTHTYSPADLERRRRECSRPSGTHSYNFQDIFDELSDHRKNTVKSLLWKNAPLAVVYIAAFLFARDHPQSGAVSGST